MQDAVGLRDILAVGAVDEVVARGAFHVLARAERIVGGDAIDELVEVVELDVAHDEVANLLGAALRDFGSDVDKDDRAGQLRFASGETHRDHAPH